ncbi:MAG: AraC family transcriptional regulator [Lachnospiraceae bacterium]|nr:AraC family transcriptional regulator [Lachnospiraceae bacterium]
MNMSSEPFEFHPDVATIDDTVLFFSDLLHCNGKIVISKYNGSGSLMFSNTTGTVYDTMLRNSKHIEDAVAFGENNQTPLMIIGDYGLMWSIVFLKDELDQLQSFYTIGPVMTAPITEEDMEAIRVNRNIKEKWKPYLVKYLQELPILPATEVIKDTLMLHYCVHKEYLKPSNITILDFDKSSDDMNSSKNAIDFSYANYYDMENGMLDLVRQGNIHFKNKTMSASSILNQFKSIGSNDVQMATQYAVIFCGLCIRAAIDGGLTPDSAYTTGNMYIKNLRSAKTVVEILSITNRLFEDLIHRVHMEKDKSHYSREIHSCISYIELHPDEPLSIEYLSDKIGYSKYYLSKKFKSEVNMSVNSYIKKIRIEQASFLLTATDMDIQEISSQLHFGNRNFFSKVFKEETGESPAYFRETHRK